ncbi:PEP-CTERM sorting domain-containing protein [Arenibaculum pallidiluteum]|uniref:PEP-CTERM sorting domain-containing protein n=1 Tax=Arenibaculum pallidiluteum TaxID=2812559 RepID=UPI001A963650|nr:PEP-CTERM sorting domain-containing protein [Arenibaculum pallidiluteum]
MKAPIAFMLATLAASGAQAAIIDQQQLEADSSYRFGETVQWHQLAQSFTSGVDGTLTGLSLRLGRQAGTGTDGTVRIEIRDTEYGPASYGTGYSYTQTPGSPDIPPAGGQILASLTLSAADLADIDPTQGQIASFTTLLMLPNPVEILSGVTYSILVEGFGTTTFLWSQQRSGTYAGGEGFARVDDGYGWSFTGTSPGRGDFAFSTQAVPSEPPGQVPEPATAGLLGVALAGIAGLRRRNAGR